MPPTWPAGARCPSPATLAAALLQFVTELLVGRNYGLALLFITPLALIMGQAARRVPVDGLLLDRGVETVVGSLVGVAVLLLTHWLVRRRTQPAAGQEGA